MRISTIRLLSVLVVVLFVEGAVRADYMNWSYHWSISPSPVLASGTGTVSQALGAAGKGAHRILAAAVTTSSDATTRNPDRYNKNFALTLHLMDRATHQSGSMTFHGNISGTLTATTSHLTETFRNYIQYLHLGRHIYLVELPHFMRLMAPGSLVIPYYYAQVWVENAPPIYSPVKAASVAMIHTASLAVDPHTPAPAAPEPSGLVLAGLGVALLGSGALRRGFLSSLCRFAS